MKRILFICIVLANIFSIGLFAQSEFFYTPKGEKKTLKKLNESLTN